MIHTEAWVLHRSSEPRPGSALENGDFRLEEFSFEPPGPDEILIEPIYGSWEANMSHAVARQPIDVCIQRNEEKVVLGNTGVARLVELGPGVKGMKPGDLGVMWGVGALDEHGYMITAHGYDAPRSIGVLTKLTKVRASQLIPLPGDASIGLKRWTAFTLRHLTAWSNWKLAYGVYRLQMGPDDDPAPEVWGWGGGTTFAELQLAKLAGCKATMISGSDAHLEAITRAGMRAVDRREFPDLDFDSERYEEDRTYRRQYNASEIRFLKTVRALTQGRGVAIFIDYIGTPVYRATLRALGRQGVLSTAGWKAGMKIELKRAVECIQRHVHVHTHFARASDWEDARDFALKTGWIPDVTEEYRWEDVGRLAVDAASNRLGSYFPVFEVNPL